MLPEEDKLLCIHEFCDLYGADDVDKNDPYLIHVVFFCKKCLQLRHKSYRRDRARLDPEWLADFHDGGGVEQSL